MHFHIILTEKCNSQCRYCYEKSMKEFDNGLEEKFEFDFSAPSESEVKLEELKKFLEQDENPILIFYGGEPLLQIEKIKKIIDKVNAKFRMQTNGKILDKLPIKYLKKIDKILISIDGNKKRTDFNRGKGTFEKVISNLKLIREQGYKGEIVARMTLTFPDVFEQIKNLLSLNLFDSIHWQIDAGFYKFDFNEKEFSNFVKEYNSQISNLIEFWISEMKKARVLKFYPLLGIFESLYYNRPTKLRCGAGYSNYTIDTNGKIVACPIMNNIKTFHCGNLKSKISELKKIGVIEPCTKCEYLNLCGGRCLYSNYAKLWPKQGQELICKTIIHLIKELKKALPEIKSLIEKGIVKKSDFEYEKYFGPEIIP